MKGDPSLSSGESYKDTGSQLIQFIRPKLLLLLCSRTNHKINKHQERKKLLSLLIRSSDERLQAAEWLNPRWASTLLTQLYIFLLLLFWQILSWGSQSQLHFNKWPPSPILLSRQKFLYMDTFSFPSKNFQWYPQTCLSSLLCLREQTFWCIKSKIPSPLPHLPVSSLFLVQQ